MRIFKISPEFMVFNVIFNNIFRKNEGLGEFSSEYLF
jgi:hypothetical protein